MRLSIRQQQAFARRLKCVANGCHEWQGQTNSHGYGVLRIGSVTDGSRRMARAHRIAWFLAYGETPDVLCHRCDNPRCCNVAHLFAGTKADNTRDMVQKGRHGSKVGMPIRWSKLDRAAAAAMRCLRCTGGYTQKALGRLFGVSQAQTGRILRGTVRYS
jgi:hypothetical protein